MGDFQAIPIRQVPRREDTRQPQGGVHRVRLGGIVRGLRLAPIDGSIGECIGCLIHIYIYYIIYIIILYYIYVIILYNIYIYIYIIILYIYYIILYFLYYIIYIFYSIIYIYMDLNGYIYINWEYHGHIVMNNCLMGMNGIWAKNIVPMDPTVPSQETWLDGWVCLKK